MNGSLYCPDCLEVDIDLNILNHDLALLAPTTAKRKKMNQAGEAIYRMEPPCLDPS